MDTIHANACSSIEIQCGSVGACSCVFYCENIIIIIDLRLGENSNVVSLISALDKFDTTTLFQ